MPLVEATVEIPVAPAVAYRYLHDRYEGEAYRSACAQAKGYVPPLTRTESIADRRIAYSVPGRDSVFGFPTSSWKWSYEIDDAGGERSRITIRYSWTWVLSVLSLWTVRHQAANELTETVLALEGLAERSG